MSHNSSFHSFILLLPPSLNHFPAASSPLLPCVSLDSIRYSPIHARFRPLPLCIDPLRSPFFPLCSSSVINPSLQACKQKSGDWEEEEAASELPEEPMCLMQGPIHQNGKKNTLSTLQALSLHKCLTPYHGQQPHPLGRQYVLALHFTY